MEHRLIVTSECGYIYDMVNGKYNIVYDANDETEYYGKITRYDNNLLVIGGYKYLNFLVKVNEERKYGVWRIHTGYINHSEVVKFIDDFLVIVFSSHNAVVFLPVEEIYTNMLRSLPLPFKCYILQLRPFFPFKSNSIDFLDERFLIGMRVYNNKTLESGMLSLNKDLSFSSKQSYGWKSTKLSVIDGKIYTLCNNVYKTEKKSCLVVDGKVVVGFHEAYELNDFSVTDENIYIVGRYIIDKEITTINRGVVVVLDRKYNLIDIYPMKGSGAFLGCISLDKDYANDRIICNCTDFVKAKMKDNIYLNYVSIPISDKNN